MFRSFLHLIRNCRPQWRLYLAGTLALVVVDVLDTFTPKLTQWGIDHLTVRAAGGDPSNPLVGVLPASFTGPGAAAGGLWVYGVLFVLVVATTGFFRYWLSMSYARAAVRLTHEQRGRFFATLQRQDASWHDRSKVGDHMTLATNDTEACRMFFGIGLLLLLDTGLYFILVPAYMMSISVKLMLASALTLPLIPFVVAKLTHIFESRFERVQQQFGVVSEHARESFAGARVVKSFAREESEVRAFAAVAREYMRRGLTFAKVMALEVSSLPLMLALADLVVVVYGGALVIRGEMTIGQYVAFFQYLIRLSGPMIGLGWTVTLFQRARVSMGRIEEAMSVTPAIREPEAPARLTDVRGEVEFRDVTFAYGEDSESAIAGVSFSVRPGGTLGIVGEVGSGKTTVLNLLPRLYDPPPDSVFLDGHDVRDLPLGRLRGAIGVVPQEAFLFGETIRTNVAAGMPDGEAADGSVERALRMAQIEADVLQLPQRYETLLGERGVNLSGGQKQRVAIARALAREPAVLLFDDCLSAVDTETEETILEGMREAGRGRTAIIVSHRISAVRDADEIVVLAEGKVVERGTHAELVALGGIYADLERKQTMESEEEDADGHGG